jgi:hypothetical protein
VTIRTYEVLTGALDAKSGHRLTVVINKRSLGVLPGQVSDHQEARESVLKRGQAILTPCRNWAAEQQVHMRSAQLLLQPACIASALYTCIREPIAGPGSPMEPRFAFGDGRARAIPDAKLRDEVECDGTSSGARQRRRDEAAHDHSSERHEELTSRYRLRERTEETIGRAQQCLANWPSLGVVGL